MDPWRDGGIHEWLHGWMESSLLLSLDLPLGSPAKHRIPILKTQSRILKGGRRGREESGGNLSAGQWDWTTFRGPSQPTPFQDSLLLCWAVEEEGSQGELPHLCQDPNLPQTLS